MSAMVLNTCRVVVFLLNEQYPFGYDCLLERQAGRMYGREENVPHGYSDCRALPACDA